MISHKLAHKHCSASQALRLAKLVTIMSSYEHLKQDSVILYEDEVLGTGSYGKVCKAKFGQLTCAAKLLHETMFDRSNYGGKNTVIEKFEQECEFLSKIRHPNIVQFLGTIGHPKLALLMELMDGSLTTYLEKSVISLPFHIQLNICYDVALALSYLHSKPIIHRDLSSNNVLLIGEGNRAKVTDFGMSKMGVDICMTQQTLCPGTVVYMPPEALTSPPRYSNKLDCFSHGVLTIQIVTRKFPSPGDAHVQERHHHLRQVPEIERRKASIDHIEPDHPLLPIALWCLADREEERPSADNLCERLSSLKLNEQYIESKYQLPLISRLQEELEEAREEIRRKDEELKTKDEANLETTPEVYPATIVPDWFESSAKPTQLTWKEGGISPRLFSSAHGTSAVDGNTAYFSCKGDIYSYSLPDHKWAHIEPSCGHQGFGMAIINSKLTIIGGRKLITGELQNELLSMSFLFWGSDLPSMPTKRSQPAVASTPTHLVVAGGETDNGNTNAVEILDIDRQWWSRVENLRFFFSPKVVFSNGLLYCLNLNFFSCSLEDLLSSSEHFTTNSSVWTELNDTGIFNASLLNFREHVLAIQSGSIHSYNKDTNVWSEIGQLPSLQSDVLTAVLSNDKVIVVGGRNESCEPSYSTYLGST